MDDDKYFTESNDKPKKKVNKENTSHGELTRYGFQTGALLGDRIGGSGREG
jgi:hypothetical protein